MASYRKRGSKWQVRITRKDSEPIARSFPLRSDAEKWARAVERDLDLGRYAPQEAVAAVPLADLIDRYQTEVLPLLRGADSERYRLKSLRARLGSIKCPDLNVNHAASYRDERLSLVSKATVLRELQSFSALLNHARREWGIDVENVVSRIRKPASNNARTRRISEQEWVSLQETLSSSQNEGASQGTRNPMILPIVRIAIETAMRQGEILSLRWCDVDLDRKCVKLPMTKNGDARLVPLSPTAVEIFAGLEGKHPPSDRVFPTSASALKQAWVRACRRVGLSDLRFHDLRHEATSRLAERLPNVIELAAVTGHRDVRMLARYYHPKIEGLAQKLSA